MVAIHTIIRQDTQSKSPRNGKKPLVVTRAFYDEYQRTHNMERTLSYAFWCVLADKHPELVSTYELSELMNMAGLGNVYKYSYDMLKNTLA